MSQPPYIVKAPSIFRRFVLYIRSLWTFFFVSFLMLIRRYTKTFPKPTLRLSYDQSLLPSRWTKNTVDVFFPTDYEGSAKSPLPIFFDIHGGAFIVGEPSIDAHFCRALADQASCIVVTLPYRKAPFTKFPYAIHDLATLIQLVLDDPRLASSIDKTKVGIGGHSAGANIAGGVSILKEMRGKIGAFVGIHPVLDFTMTTKERISLRPKGPDYLSSAVDMIGQVYAGYDVDRRDARLSPIYADAWKLPQNVFISGAELDILCCDVPRFEKKFSNKLNNLHAEIVKDVIHGFTFIAEFERDPVKKALYEKETHELNTRIARWLTVEVWKTKPEEVFVRMDDQGHGEELGRTSSNDLSEEEIGGKSVLV